ncbi:hypothetical protein [Streptomyces nanshensis]|uniref:Uncharacterized protein n=1 Tax=Streptomyces nanshensis TaxID=518642 RepID=A0A1E7KTX7_9ACTN|nr:hypothetical protein [Streptomyces nanshensis]OEV07382.1 hypothetical protein AN218_29340 [Streptomyces nanshensis]
MQMEQGQSRGDVLVTVRVEAALTGPVEHRTTAQASFEQMGWEVLHAEETDPALRTPGGVLPDEAIHISFYTLDIPVGRDARRPERWAVQEVKDLADNAHLDLRPVSARMLRRQRRQEPHWFVCTPRSTHSYPWVRWLFNLERSMGFHDTGTVLFGPYEEAQRRAGEGRVRPPFPRRVQAHDELRRTRVGEGRRRVLRAVALSWAAGILGLPVAAGPWWLALPALATWALLTWWCATVMLPLARQRHTVQRRRTDSPALDSGRTTTGDGNLAQPDEDEEVIVYRHQRARAWLAAVAVSGVFFAVTAWMTWNTNPASAVAWHLLLAGTVFVTPGIRHLARAGSRRPFLVAFLVALLPVAVPALGGLSPVLFTFYGAAFHTRAEEIDVSNVWQFLASTYVLGISTTLSLVFLASWGYLRPLFRDRTLRPFLPIVAITGAMALTLAWATTVLDTASAAGDKAVRQWRSGQVPDHYYGANPQPVCVTPIGPLDELPLDGHQLDPEQVYGSFGAVGGQVNLWDPTSGDAFPVPSDAVQVLPAGDSEPGGSIPRACPS